MHFSLAEIYLSRAALKFSLTVGCVIVLTIWFCFGRADGDAGASGVVEKVIPAAKALEKFRYSPRSNDLDLWINGKKSQF